MWGLDPGTRIGDVLIERLIGRGGCGNVYLGRDAVIGRPVALKILRAPGGEIGAHQRSRILTEGRIIGALSSPHVVTLYKAQPLDGDAGWIFEMEYVEGGSLAERLNAEPIPFDEALRIMTGVLRGLRSAHERGIVHGDIKPGNVLLGHHGSVKLADFGLSRLLVEDVEESSESGALLGTPEYMAPEAIMGERPTFASDIWSAGVLLYRLLGDRLPFATGHLPTLFYSIQNAPPDDLPSTTPPDLRRLVRACLSKSPGDRPRTCTELLETLANVTGRTARAPARPVLVGRDEECERLQQMLDAVAAGHGRGLVLAGEAGIGKSALALHLKTLGAHHRFRWIRMHVTQVGSLLRRILDGLKAIVEREGFPADAFGDAAPTLEKLLKDDSTALQDQRQSLWGCEELLRGLSRELPIGLVVEDAHLAHEDDQRLLRELARRLSESRVLLVATFRTLEPEAAADPGTLASAPNMERLDLIALDARAIYQLLESHAEEAWLAPEVVDRVLSTSDGNPLFAIELLRHLLETRAVVPTGRKLVAGPEWKRASLPKRCQELFAKRLEGLPEAHRALLDAAAVDGLEFDGEAIAAAIDRPLLEVLRDLQRLYRERGLIAPHPQGYRFCHGLLQELIYREISEDLRRLLHRRLAEHLEARGRGSGVDPERLGQHLERAGEPEGARPYLIAATAVAVRRQEPRRAHALARRAHLIPLELPHEGVLFHWDLLCRLAAICANLGRGWEARAIFERLDAAALAAGDEERRVRAYVHRVRNLYFSEGSSAVDETELRSVAQRLGPCRELGMARYVLGLVSKYRSALPEAEAWMRGADEAYQAIGDDAGHAASIDQIASIAARQGRVAEAEALYAEAARICRRIGNRMNAAVSEVNRVLSALHRGVLQGLEETLQSCLRMLVLEGAEGLHAHANVTLGTVLFAKGDAAGARHCVDAALDSLRRSGYLPGLLEVLRLDAILLVTKGDLDGAAERIAEGLELALKAGNRSGRAHLLALETQRLCLAGRTEEAEAAAREAIGTADGGADHRARLDVGIWIGECVAFGLAPVLLADARQLLLALPEHERAMVERVERFLRGAEAYASETGSIHDLRDASEALRETGIGERRASLQTLASLFAAEAEERAGDLEAAEREAEAGLAAARRLGHVWLEADLAAIPRGRGPGGS